MDMTAQPIEVHLRTDANNLVTTAASTRLPEQKETIHMIQMLRQEACSGQMHDLAHVLTQYCLADPLTKKSVSATLSISTVQTGILREVDAHPPFRSTVQHKAFITEIVYPDAEATEDHWARLMCYPIFFKIQKGTKSPLVSKESLTGRCFISATGPDGTRTTSTTLEKPLPSLEVMTGFIVLETHGGSRLSDYWQQKTKSRLSRVHVTPRKTLFTPSHAPVDLSFAVHSLLLASNMPSAPTRSTADNMTAARQKVGPPSILGANPNSYFLKDMFNGMFSLYMIGRFFQQRKAKEEFWTEDPTALTQLLVNDVQWYEQHFRKVSKMLTMLLHHSNDQQLRHLRRNRIQGDIVLIDFL